MEYLHNSPKTVRFQDQDVNELPENDLEDSETDMETQEARTR